MTSGLGRRAKWRRRLLFGLPCMAALLVALEFWIIHPASSFVGGILYLLFGSWGVPTAINILLAVWVALLFRVHFALRLLVGVAASFVLGVNTSLPILLHLSALPPADMAVLRPVVLVPSLGVDSRAIAATPDISSDQVMAPPGIRLGGDEGCGCMYWLASSEGYRPRIQKLIDARGFSVTRGLYRFSDQLPDVAPYNQIVHFKLEFAPSSTRRDDLVDLTVDVYQGWRKVAWFRQRQLPVMTAGPLGRMQPLLNEHFAANVASILMHHGIWATILGNRLQHDDGLAAFTTFLERAFPAASNQGSVVAEADGEPSVVEPAKANVPVPGSQTIVETLKITTEQGSQVDWVTVSASPLFVGTTCPSTALATSVVDDMGRIQAEGIASTVEKRDDGSFEARVTTDNSFKPVEGCQRRLNLAVTFYSKGAVVGDAYIDDDLLHSRGEYVGTCVSERADYTGTKPNYMPLCMIRDSGTATNQRAESTVRSFAWNHVFDARVALEDP